MGFIMAYGNDVRFPEIQVPKSKLKYFDNLEDAARARTLSGDLIFDETTHEIIEDHSWLFDWEAKNNSYALRAIKARAKLKII